MMIGRKYRIFALLGLLALALAACRGGAPGPAPTDPASAAYPNGGLLVSTDWLQAHLDDPNLRVIDMRSPQDYAQGHVRGAVNIPVTAIASTIDDIPLEFDRAEVEQALGKAGLTPETTAVIYDDLGMMSAARLFWTLEYAGHQDARVLNGGWNAWAAEGLPTTDEAPQVRESDYALALNPDRLASADYVLEHLDDPQVVIVDARSPQEYSGEVRLAERGGHIPGAVNLVWLEALAGGDAVFTVNSDWQEQLRDEDVEVFKSNAELAALLDGLGITPDKEVITYCQTMWRAAHVYFLLRLMGFEDVRGYDGSWAEWGNDPDLPIASGPGD